MLIDFALLTVSLFRWMPFPLNVFAVGVFAVLLVVFLIKFWTFLKNAIPFF